MIDNVILILRLHPYPPTFNCNVYTSSADLRNHSKLPVSGGKSTRVKVT